MPSIFIGLFRPGGVEVLRRMSTLAHPLEPRQLALGLFALFFVDLDWAPTADGVDLAALADLIEQAYRALRIPSSQIRIFRLEPNGRAAYHPSGVTNGFRVIPNRSGCP